MGGKAAIALGLVAGLAVGGAVVAGVIALAPPVPVPASLETQAAIASPAPTAPEASSTSGPATPAPGSTSPATEAPADSDAPDESAEALASPPEGGVGEVPDAGGGFAIGKPAPALVLPAVGGGTVDLASMLGKPVWVNFVTSSCQACRKELPVMQTLAAKYGDTGLAVLLVDVKEDEAAAKAFLDDLDVYLPAGVDKDGTAQAAWGATELPVHFWIDGEGIVRQWEVGATDADVMAEGLQAILPGVEVTP